MQISQLLDSSYKCTADFNAFMHLVSKTNVEVPWSEAEKNKGALVIIVVFFYTGRICVIESIKTTSMEGVSTRVFEKIKNI